jgi:serine protease Do
VQQLAKSGSVQRAYLGVGIEPVNGDLAHKFGVERGQGVLVAEVFPRSPAAEAGFEAGDVITSFAGTTVKTPRDLQEIVEQAPLGSKQAVVVQREGKEVTLQVTVKQLPKDLGQTAHNEKEGADEHSQSNSYKAGDLGLELTDMTPEQAVSLGLQGYKGALVSEVTPDGLAAEAGIREGMLILKVGKKPVENIEQFKAALQGQSVKDGVLLLVRTEAGNRFIVLRQDAQ